MLRLRIKINYYSGAPCMIKGYLYGSVKNQILQNSDRLWAYSILRKADPKSANSDSELKLCTGGIKRKERGGSTRMRLHFYFILVLLYNFI